MTSLFNISLKEKNVNGKSVGSGWAVTAVTVLIVGLCSVAVAQDAAKAPAGAEIFKSKCVLCHGADGSGNTPLGKQLQAANLHSKEVQKLGNDEMHKIIHDGQANMPPFEDKLTDDEIDQVIQYVRTFAAAPAKAAKKQ
jgi:cytochrome c6